MKNSFSIFARFMYIQAKEWAELDPEDRSQNFLPQRYMP